jgi:hypothetical protein
MRDTHFRVNLSDTSPKASKFYFERLAALSPGERVRICVGLWEAAQSLQWATTRLKYPDADEAEIAFHVAVTRFGVELARRVYKKA